MDSGPMAEPEDLHHFFTDTLRARYTHSAARAILAAKRSVPISPYDLRVSRKIRYSILIFLYREEEGMTLDTLWSAARQVVLSLLRGTMADDAGTVGAAYLAAFESWVTNERIGWVREVAGTLYNLEEIGRAVRATGHDQTVSEWEPMHTRLGNTIRAAMQRVRMGDEVDAELQAIRRMRDVGVGEYLRRAYWDLMEEEVQRGDHTRLFAQLAELSHYMHEIVPRDRYADVDTLLDMEYIRQRVLHDVADALWVQELTVRLVEMCQSYDSLEASPHYDRILADIGTRSEQNPLFVYLRLVTPLIVSLYHRKRAWADILHAPPIPTDPRDRPNK